jgi:hypothetical protein
MVGFPRKLDIGENMCKSKIGYLKEIIKLLNEIKTLLIIYKPH